MSYSGSVGAPARATIIMVFQLEIQVALEFYVYFSLIGMLRVISLMVNMKTAMKIRMKIFLEGNEMQEIMLIMVTLSELLGR